jgi:NAD(P)-dependent dehydrogenase (short-subunit alcohol dehydrogenase family)
MIELKGKTALVTGASRGIGRSIAATLAAAGARVIVHYGNSRADAESVVAEIKGKGGHAEAVAADLSSPDGPHQLATQVRGLIGGRLDVLIANAGVSKSVPLDQTTVADFDRLFATNVRGPFFLVQQLLPVLGEGSSVVFVSSVVAHTAVPNLVAYAGTKGAINTLVVQLAAQLGKQGIRVNAIAPGVIDTDMSSFAKTEQGRAFTLHMQALQRIGKPDDIADAVAFLASDAARWVTGTVVRADGGSKL